SAVPGAGGEPEDLRVHIQTVEGGGEDVEEGAEAERMGLHRPGEIEQEGHGAIGLGPLRSSAEDAWVTGRRDQPGQPRSVEDPVLGVDELVSVLRRLDDTVQAGDD